jgi:hypothetical protein
LSNREPVEASMFFGEEKLACFWLEKTGRSQALGSQAITKVEKVLR